MIQLIVRGIIYHDNQYLLVQQKGQNFWCLPGGKVEANEPITAALERELVEELGVKPQVGQLLYVQQLIEGGIERVEFFFIVTNGADYIKADFTTSTHGTAELSKAEFVDITAAKVLPEFLAAQLPTLQKADFTAPVRFFLEDITFKRTS